MLYLISANIPPLILHTGPLSVNRACSTRLITILMLLMKQQQPLALDQQDGPIWSHPKSSHVTALPVAFHVYILGVRHPPASNVDVPGCRYVNKTTW